MGLFSFIGWIIGLIFSFAFNRIDDIFVWIIPCYMTVYIIKKNESSKYENYLCFWIMLAIILGIEYVTFGLLNYIYFYRIFRLFFIIWLQIDYCANASATFIKIKPFISKDVEDAVEKGLNSVTQKLDEHGGKIKEKASDQFWSIVQQNYELIKDSLFSALTTVSNKAVDLTDTNSSLSAQQKAAGEKTNSDNNDDKKEKEQDNNSQKESIQKKES